MGSRYNSTQAPQRSDSRLDDIVSDCDQSNLRDPDRFGPGKYGRPAAEGSSIPRKRLKIKMAASEKDTSSRVVCTIDLTKDLTPTVDLTQSSTMSKKESTFVDHVVESTNYYKSDLSQKETSSLSSQAAYKNIYANARLKLVKEGVWYKMSQDERREMMNKIRSRIKSKKLQKPDSTVATSHQKTIEEVTRPF